MIKSFEIQNATTSLLENNYEFPIYYTCDDIVSWGILMIDKKTLYSALQKLSSATKEEKIHCIDKYLETHFTEITYSEIIGSPDDSLYEKNFRKI